MQPVIAKPMMYSVLPRCSRVFSSVMIPTHAMMSATAINRINVVLRFILRGVEDDFAVAPGWSRVRNLPTGCALGGKKRVVALFLRDRCQGTVAAGEHGVARQPKDLLDVVSVLVAVV